MVLLTTQLGDTFVGTPTLFNLLLAIRESTTSPLELSPLTAKRGGFRTSTTAAGFVTASSQVATVSPSVLVRTLVGSLWWSYDEQLITVWYKQVTIFYSPTRSPSKLLGSASSGAVFLGPLSSL